VVDMSSCTTPYSRHGRRPICCGIGAEDTNSCILVVLLLLLVVVLGLLLKLGLLVLVPLALLAMLLLVLRI